MVGTPGLITGHIIGTSQLSYTDFTPIASLINDYTVFAVAQKARTRLTGPRKGRY